MESQYSQCVIGSEGTALDLSLLQRRAGQAGLKKRIKEISLERLL